MMDAKRGCEQSDDGSRFSVDSLYESDSIIEFDGAVKGNRGSAGAGVVLHDVDGSLVHILDLSYLTFSIDADEEKLISCERTDVNLLTTEEVVAGPEKIIDPAKQEEATYTSLLE
ncbi:hypothetical protein Tco_1397566 [Tanacetum coccineum]